MEIIDPISEIIVSNIDSLYDATKNFITDTNQKIKSQLKTTFSKYLESIKRKYSSTKTIIYRDTPQSIEKFYEPIDLFNDTINLSNPDISDLVSIGKPIIITGTGGSGKSTFLKYLLLNSIEKTKLIPLFIELRDVENSKQSLLEYITSSLQLKKVKLESPYLDLAFRKGNFLFLLDGFDELSLDFSTGIGEEIELLTQNYTNCHFIVTSRPGKQFIAWTNFVELHTTPLTLSKAVSLVRRLNFDPEIKQKFILELESSLYNSHRSFFENPLLLSIMLITYRDSASIPSELHNFYYLAFEALYYRHDASKSFKRPTLTGLPVNKGKDIMAAFSLTTYLKTKTSFNKHELDDFLKNAMRLADCECVLDDLIVDLLQSFCMLLQDGTLYEYTHRSFQEYFAACYLVSTSEQNQIILIDQFVKKADTDITLQLAYGMNPKLVEEKLIIPFLTRFRERIGYKSKLNKTVFKKFAREYFDDVLIDLNRDASLTVRNVNKLKTKGEIEPKVLDLITTRLLIKIYDIDNNFIVTKNNKLPKLSFIKYQLDESGKPIKNMMIDEYPLSTALKDEALLEWFMMHSIESRVLEKLINLEEELRIKNKFNNDLFLKLLNNQ
ncbi:NACHT domain-containing NTPase [uncultured Fluviicola sp.]|uniref:NACHT domain-containing protein n=1 Tax=uncultured Fluviicola sp. TaxID=463303 RepID=UPI0025FF066C|nr:NACHT domain-containing protein [uncultured Fluviicola sp.]